MDVPGGVPPTVSWDRPPQPTISKSTTSGKATSIRRLFLRAPTTTMPIKPTPLNPSQAVNSAVGCRQAAFVEAGVEIVSKTCVGAEPAGTGFDANRQVDFAGSPEQVRVKAESVAGFGVTTMWSVPV